MIKVNIVAVRIPTERGMGVDQLLDAEAYICPGKIDTVTPVTNHEQHQVPKTAKSVIRYYDAVNGFRLMYVTETAQRVAKARRREMKGEDSDSIDFGDSLPDGI